MAEQTFGERLKQLREQAGLTQEQLAERAGLHRFGVAKLERDERQPAWWTVQALAHALGTNCLAFEGTVRPKEEDEERPARPRGRPRKHPEQPEQPGGLVEGLPGGEAGQGAEKPKKKRKGKP